MRFVIALLLSFLVAVPAQAVAPLPKPKLMAVYFYADWCPNCKVLSPLVNDARAKGDLDTKDVLFVTMNLTNKATIHQSILLAQGLGIGEFLRAQGSATGYVAVLDASSKKELARFDREDNAAAIQAGIETLLKPHA